MKGHGEKMLTVAFVAIAWYKYGKLVQRNPTVWLKL